MEVNNITVPIESTVKTAILQVSEADDTAASTQTHPQEMESHMEIDTVPVVPESRSENWVRHVSGVGDDPAASVQLPLPPKDHMPLISEQKLAFWTNTRVGERPTIMYRLIRHIARRNPVHRPPRTIIYAEESVRATSLYLELSAKYDCVSFISQNMPKGKQDREVQDFLKDKTRIIVCLWFDKRYSTADCVPLRGDLIFFSELPPQMEYLGPHAMRYRYGDSRRMPIVVGLYDEKRDGYLKGVWEQEMETMGYENMEVERA